jgi:hypothetical protein
MLTRAPENDVESGKEQIELSPRDVSYALGE